MHTADWILSKGNCLVLALQFSDRYEVKTAECNKQSDSVAGHTASS
jgi:hypothetical protein